MVTQHMSDNSGWKISTAVFATICALLLVGSGYLINQANTRDAYEDGRAAESDAKMKAADAKSADADIKLAAAEANNDSVKADREKLDTDNATFIAWRDAEIVRLNDSWAPLWNESERVNATNASAMANFTAANSLFENATVRNAEANTTLLAAQNLSASVNVTLVALGKNATSASATGGMTCYVVDPSFTLEQTAGTTICLVVRDLETVSTNLACTATKPTTLIYRTSDGVEHRDALPKDAKGVAPGFSFSFSEAGKATCVATKS